tara:strand:- start:11366 stop:11602 length:237 start_codon:yes stop_codon:yes gene_type:complete
MKELFIIHRGVTFTFDEDLDLLGVQVTDPRQAKDFVCEVSGEHFGFFCSVEEMVEDYQIDLWDCVDRQDIDYALLEQY